MKRLILLSLMVLASQPAFAQAQCKAFFQLLKSDGDSPGLRVGLNPVQKKWWEGKGRKKYPGLCLDGSVMSADKPRFLVIWSKSKPIGQASLLSSEVYGQPAAALQATAPAAPIYQPRWDQASVTVVNVLYDGSLMLPPIYFEADQHSWVLFPDSPKVLEGAMKYLSQERVFLPQADQ